MDISIVILFCLIALLFIITSKIRDHLGSFLSKNIIRSKLVVYLLWIIYFPGIFLHEAAHLVSAIALLLRVDSIYLLPSIKTEDDGKKSIKFGYVTYYRADPVRGLLVGIAPFILGTIVLVVLFNAISFPNEKILNNIFFIYTSFVISSTMFSSKQDLRDLLYIIPTIILFVIILNLFTFHPLSYVKLSLSIQENGIAVVNKLNQIFSISLSINVFIYAIVKVLRL